MVECSVVNNCNGETKSMTRKECCVDDSQGRSYVAEGMCYSCIGIHYVFVGTLLNVLFWRQVEDIIRVYYGAEYFN